MGKAKFNRIEAVYEQYQQIREKLTTACDPQEKNRLFRRLVNLLGVMEFLISLSKTP
ncbi:hypothetical protein [Geomesophilobacter sediminis]|uniref:Uncharacterized protein n=1 Tax=Geomesophilobacter sediminis TaxID=2798584 RepID=A0A8J7M2T6_9BACT|nr:hypothetical protein [Geomesophilobacter sediminis]MBJ6727703.1 hypothetical protein [Geomesophilobacter sediminis]